MSKLDLYPNLNSAPADAKVQTGTSLAGNKFAGDVAVLLSALPSGAATAANQATEIASLASIDAKLTAPNALTDRSGTASTTDATLAATNAAREYLFFHNLSGSVNMWIRFGAAAVANAAGTIQVGPKDWIEWTTRVPTEAVHVIAGSGTPTYTAFEA